jgi:hypothetical protein
MVRCFGTGKTVYLLCWLGCILFKSSVLAADATYRRTREEDYVQFTFFVMTAGLRVRRGMTVVVGTVLYLRGEGKGVAVQVRNTTRTPLNSRTPL